MWITLHPHSSSVKRISLRMNTIDFILIFYDYDRALFVILDINLHKNKLFLADSLSDHILSTGL